MLIEKQEQFLAFSYFALIQTLCAEVGLNAKRDAPIRFALQQVLNLHACDETWRIQLQQHLQALDYHAQCRT
jgi:hypothetical protein